MCARETPAASCARARWASRVRPLATHLMQLEQHWHRCRCCCLNCCVGNGCPLARRRLGHHRGARARVQTWPPLCAAPEVLVGASLLAGHFAFMCTNTRARARVLTNTCTHKHELVVQYANEHASRVRTIELASKPKWLGHARLWAGASNTLARARACLLQIDCATTTKFIRQRAPRADVRCHRALSNACVQPRPSSSTCVFAGQPPTTWHATTTTFCMRYELHTSDRMQEA